MNLRYKFGSLALLYVVALTVNVALCSWCILSYHDSLFARFGSSRSGAGAAGSLQFVQILLVNAACALVLALIGLRLVQRWVSRPVATLRKAAAEISSGNLSYRIPVQSQDEMGVLAASVNDMVETLVGMQQRLVEQERRATAHQTVRCVVHNIRSPLTGIRWLAEAISLRKDASPQAVEDQQRVVAAVDRVLEWLKQFRESLSSASLRVRAESPVSLIDEVVRRCRPALDERQVRVRSQVDPDVEAVSVDREQLVPTLAAVLDWVAAQCPAGATVDVMAGRRPQDRSEWQVIFGCGDSSAAPTEGDAHGDKAMVDRVIQLHGGRWERCDDPSGGTRYVVCLPC